MTPPLNNRAGAVDWRPELQRLLELSALDRAGRLQPAPNAAGIAVTGGDAIEPPIRSSHEPLNDTHCDPAETAVVPTEAKFVNGGNSQAQEPDPLEAATRPRPRAWKLGASALALVSAATVGSFFVLNGGRSKLWKQPASISKADFRPATDVTVMPSNDAGAPLANNDRQTAPVWVVNSKEPHVGPVVQPLHDSALPAVIAPAPIGASEQAKETSSTTPVPLPQDLTPNAAPPSSVVTSSENSVVSEPRRPAVESASKTADDSSDRTARTPIAISEPQTKPQSAPSTPITKSDADPATPGNAAKPPGARRTHRTRARHEKASGTRSAAGIAVEPPETPAASASGAQETVDTAKGGFPLLRAISDQLAGTAARAQ